MGSVGGFDSLPMARCDDGQDGGFGGRFWCVCVVPCWVRVTDTCINELMRRLMLAFKSPLVLWLWCPPLYPTFFSSFFLKHKYTLYTHKVSTYSFTSPAGNTLLCFPAALRWWWWNEEKCAPTFVSLCLYKRRRDRIRDQVVCLHM